MIRPGLVRLFGLVMVALSLVAVGLSARQTYVLQRHVACQAEYNEANNERTRALEEATSQERDATRIADDAERALFTDPALSTPAADRTEADRLRLQGLFRAYQAALVDLDRERVEADVARAEHPAPPPPSQTCR